MKQLKDEIRRHERRIAEKKSLTSKQYKELKTNFQHKIASPLGLGIAFIVGFASLYLTHSAPKITGNQKITKVAKFSHVLTGLQVANKALAIITKFIR